MRSEKTSREPWSIDLEDGRLTIAGTITAAEIQRLLDAGYEVGWDEDGVLQIKEPG